MRFSAGRRRRAVLTRAATRRSNISAYKRGATILLRDSLPPRPADVVAKASPYVPSTEPHVCITDHHATVREQVGDNEFEQQAGSFFQNNNSILPSLLDYVKEAVGPRSPGDDGKRYLVDAYTGSGLFAISLADMFDRIEGVEIDKASIKWAKRNADFNRGDGRGEVGFRDGKAEEIFKVRHRLIQLFRSPSLAADIADRFLWRSIATGPCLRWTSAQGSLLIQFMFFPPPPAPAPISLGRTSLFRLIKRLSSSTPRGKGATTSSSRR